MPGSDPDYLRARARKEMVAAGFEPDVPPDAVLTAEQAAQKGELEQGGRAALVSLPWSSIDNEESRDLDQIEVAEPLTGGVIRVQVGIADVDACVPAGSTLDHHAANNTTSVYTGVQAFPMLPQALSENRTSLMEGKEREAVVFQLDIGSTGEVLEAAFRLAVVRNQARMDYETVGEWLEGVEDDPRERSTRAQNSVSEKAVEGQLRLQDEAARRLRARRQEQGMLDFETVEARPVMENGRVVDLAVPRKNAARALVENLMVTANTALAEYLSESGVPAIQRVVRTPARWPRIVEIAARYGDRLPEIPNPRALADFLASRKAAEPQRYADLSLSVVKLLGPGEYAVVRPGQANGGHFGLAVHNYTHSTAPNRRYADLVTQRLLKAALAGHPTPYPIAELEEIARRCTERENAARKVERTMRKVAAAALLQDRIGDRFEAIVTGVSAKGTFVRVVHPPVEGRVMRGERGMDVGDRVHVQLLSVDVDAGYIDFERA